MMKKRATTKEIARLASVSVGTVDRVLHNRGQVAESTKSKILKIARELDYQPNMVARHLVLKKTFKVVALLPTASQDEYWSKPKIGIDEALNDLRQIPLEVEIILFDQLNSKSFKIIADDVLSHPPDGVIISPVIYEEAKQFATHLEQRKIPYIFIDSTINDTSPLSFIGQDSFDSGYLAGKLLDWGIYQLDNPFIILPKSLTDNNMINTRRMEGFRNYFKHKGIIPKELITDLNLSNLEDEIHEIKPRGIFVPNSKVYLIADYLNKKSISEKPKLIGYDLIPKNISFLKNNIIDFLIHQEPERQGYLAIQSFIKYLVMNETSIKERQNMPLNIITKENLSYYEAN